MAKWVWSPSRSRWPSPPSFCTAAGDGGSRPSWARQALLRFLARRPGRSLGLRASISPLVRDIGLYKKLQDPQVGAHWRSPRLGLARPGVDFRRHRHHQAKTGAARGHGVCTKKSLQGCMNAPARRLPRARVTLPCAISSGRAGDARALGCPGEPTASGNGIGAKPQQRVTKPLPQWKKKTKPKQFVFPVPKAGHGSARTLPGAFPGLCQHDGH